MVSSMVPYTECEIHNKTTPKLSGWSITFRVELAKQRASLRFRFELWFLLFAVTSTGDCLLENHMIAVLSYKFSALFVFDELTSSHSIFHCKIDMMVVNYRRVAEITVVSLKSKVPNSMLKTSLYC